MFFACLYGLKHARSADVIHAFFVLPSGVPAFFLAKTFRRPLIITALGGDIHSPYRFLYTRPLSKLVVPFLLRNADEVTCISNDLEKRIHQMVDVNVNVIPDSLDTQKFKPTFPSYRHQLGLTDKYVLITLSRLIPRKNIGFIINAMKKLAQIIPESYLLIGGAGTEKDRLERLVSKLGLNTRVKLIGYVPESRLTDFYSSGDVFLNSSWHEGLCLSALEALSCGTPVVAPRVGGMIDYCDTANMYEPGDLGDLVECILRLHGTHTDRQAIVNSVKKFSVPIVGEQYLHLYKELIES